MALGKSGTYHGIDADGQLTARFPLITTGGSGLETVTGERPLLAGSVSPLPRVECKGNVEVIAAQEGSYHCSVRFQLAGICLPRRDTSYHGRLKAVPSMLGAKALR